MNFCFHFVQNGLPELLDGIGRGAIFCSAERLKSVNELRRNVAFTVEPLVKAKMNVQLVIDPRFAPGTGTRVCEGLMPDEFNNFVDHMLSTNLVKSMDLVELNPELDVNEQTTNLCLQIIDYITARL